MHLQYPATKKPKQLYICFERHLCSHLVVWPINEAVLKQECPRPLSGQRDREAQLAARAWPGQDGRRESWICQIPSLGDLILAGVGWLYPGHRLKGTEASSPALLQGLVVLFSSLYTIIFCAQLILAKCNMGAVFCGYRTRKVTLLSFRRCVPLWLLEV